MARKLDEYLSNKPMIKYDDMAAYFNPDGSLNITDGCDMSLCFSKEDAIELCDFLVEWLEEK